MQERGKVEERSSHARRSRYLAEAVSVVIRHPVLAEKYCLPLLANTLPIRPMKTESACVGQPPPLLNSVQTSVEVAFRGLSCLPLAQLAQYGSSLRRTHINHGD